MQYQWSRLIFLAGALLSSMLLAGCGSEAQQVSSADGTPFEVIQSALNKDPEEVRVVEATRYMSVTFLTDSMYTRGHLLDIKRSMPVILEEYPDVDSFFFGWKHKNNPSQYYMKVNLSRPLAGRPDWVNIMVDDIPAFADEYWLIPALR